MHASKALRWEFKSLFPCHSYSDEDKQQSHPPVTREIVGAAPIITANFFS